VQELKKDNSYKNLRKMTLSEVRAGLTLRQNKHVVRASRGKAGTTKIRPQGNLFYQPDIRLKNTPK